MSNIISITELQAYSPETIDADRGALVVAAVNDFIEGRTGRSWGEAQSGTETHDYQSVLFLRHQDIIDVTQVETGQGNATRATLDPDSYFFNEFGRLVISSSRNNFRPQRDVVHVTYTYGLLSVPSDLKLSALAIASDYYSYASAGNKEISSQSIGTYKLTYATGSDSKAGASHLEVINRYRTRNL